MRQAPHLWNSSITDYANMQHFVDFMQLFALLFGYRSCHMDMGVRQRVYMELLMPVGNSFFLALLYYTKIPIFWQI